MNSRADLQPIDCTSTRFIVAELALEHLHHEALTAILHALFEERLDLLDSLAIRRLGELELALNDLEGLAQKDTSFCQRFLQQRLQQGDKDVRECDTEKEVTSPLRYNKSNANKQTLT